MVSGGAAQISALKTCFVGGLKREGKCGKWILANYLSQVSKAWCWRGLGRLKSSTDVLALYEAATINAMCRSREKNVVLCFEGLSENGMVCQDMTNELSAQK